MRILVVGGGLAGVCLTHELLRKDCRVTLLDAGVNHSSAVAAGMINPMTFRKMVKTWMGDELIPFLIDFYKELENKTGERFFFDRTIRRAFSTAYERKLWLDRQGEIEYADYIHPIEDAETPSYVKQEFGTGIVKCPGYVDSKLFLAANQSYLKEQGVLEVSTFNVDLLDNEKLTYKGETYSHIVFAEGYHGKNNPYFGYLPIEPVKGEVLTISVDRLDDSEIVNRKCFVLPTHDGLFKLGATFTWKTTDTLLTQEAKDELLNQYADLMTKDYTVVEHEAGVRPTVSDRRPLIGEHPQYKGLYIFNGLGTKGYMIAPYFSRHFVEHLTIGTPLIDEVNIKRFKKKFANSQTI
jgi:glycine/D-amino acid oxidase-like deaminating enzyme